jgi:hypothetical protein
MVWAIIRPVALFSEEYESACVSERDHGDDVSWELCVVLLTFNHCFQGTLYGGSYWSLNGSFAREWVTVSKYCLEARRVILGRWRPRYDNVEDLVWW